MSPLHCNTVQEALWERAASSGPAALSPLLADHLGSCGACQRERHAVRELLEVTRMMPDPEPPDNIWDGFEAELQRRIARAESPLRRAWDQWGRRLSRVAAILDPDCRYSQSNSFCIPTIAWGSGREAL